MDNTASKPFMPMPISIAAEEGVHIPFLLGYNNGEGIFFLSGKYK